MGWNKLATTAYVDAQVQTADSVAELGDTTIASLADHDLLAYDNASSKWINMSKTEAGITQVTVDSSLSSSSANPVENHVVYDALALKQASDAQLTTLAGFTAAQVIRGIADDNLMTVDDADAADNDYAKFTANGLEGRSYAEVIGDLNLEVGSDVQAFGAVLDDLNTLGAVGSDGEVLIGTGSGALAWESGATLRTSIGLGSGNSPQFTDLKVSGGDLTFQGSAGLLSASGVTSGTGYKVSVHGGSGKTGNANLAAGALELAGGQGTGSGAGGDILFKVSPVGPSGNTAQNAYQTALTISDDKSATFAGAVTVAGNLDVQGTTTTVNSANTSFTDTSIQLNVADGEAAFGDSASAIVFGDSTGATSTGRIINAGTAGGGFKFMDGNATNTPTGNNNVSDGANYVDIRMRMPVLASLSNPTAIAGGIYFDGTDIYVGT